MLDEISGTYEESGVFQPPDLDGPEAKIVQVYARDYQAMASRGAFVPEKKGLTRLVAAEMDSFNSP